MTETTFAQRLLTWFDTHGRKDLPWQHDITPYRVWLSETMLQQTQVSTVIPYFLRFVEKFPTLDSLAIADIDDVLPYWSGLGYYARARNLHKTAQTIHQQGVFPDNLPELEALSGIGRSTAGAILSIAFNKPHAILDGNVKRVLARYRGINGWTGNTQTQKQLWAISEQLTPQQRCADYTQAIMDLGATVCTRSKPLCLSCPLQTDCVAYLTQRTAELPTPKPKKTLPVKTCVFLILKNAEEDIYLEKRPPIGLWGGLWSFPEFTSITDAVSWCMEKNLNITQQQNLATARHTFSHYHLDYTPFMVQTDSPINFVMEGKQTLWYNKKTALLGLAKPIQQLLHETNR
ncbi:Adenine DNA glycosylase [Patescibacteria group bacterium]|nr:Adenine DNA glycosylase [Patescibacteria group bacterium]